MRERALCGLLIQFKPLQGISKNDERVGEELKLASSRRDSTILDASQSSFNEGGRKNGRVHAKSEERPKIGEREGFKFKKEKTDQVTGNERCLN